MTRLYGQKGGRVRIDGYHLSSILVHILKCRRSWRYIGQGCQNFDLYGTDPNKASPWQSIVV